MHYEQPSSSLDSSSVKHERNHSKNPRQQDYGVMPSLTLKSETVADTIVPTTTKSSSPFRRNQSINQSSCRYYINDDRYVNGTKNLFLFTSSYDVSKKIYTYFVTLSFVKNTLTLVPNTPICAGYFLSLHTMKALTKCSTVNNVSLFTTKALNICTPLA